MKKRDQLAGLIATLGANEKRYFKLFSSFQPGEKRYMKLFELLEDKGKSDTAELCDTLGLTPAQLADDKHYLTQALLQSLRNYDQDSTELSILRNNKENAQALITRRIFSFAADMIEKALDRAWQLEAFDMIDGLLLMRNSCAQNMGKRTENDDSITMHERAALCLKEIIELMDLRGHARDLEIKAANAKGFDALMKHRLIKGGANKLKSLRAKSLWYEILAHYHSSLMNDAALLKLAKEERQLYLKHAEIKIINPIVYLTNISRLAQGETEFELRQKWVGMLQKELLDPIIKISNQRRGSIMWSANLQSLWNLRHMHRSKEALPLAESTYAQADDRSDYQRFSITFEYALILLHNDKAALAADKIDELLRYRADIRADIQPFVKLLHIMAQLQMGNYAIMSHLVKNTRLWLKKNNANDAEKDLFLKYALLIAKAPVKRKAWIDLMHEVETGKLSMITRLLQFDAWLNVIINNTEQ